MISNHHMHSTDQEETKMDGVTDAFSQDITGLAEAIAPQTIELQPDQVFELRAEQVSKCIHDTTVKMLAYNRSIPGPTLKVVQGSEVTVHFTNDTDLESTVHWHGLRLDNRFDGVPQGAHQGMMAPVPVGGSFTYRLRFPDPGLYWYHPHLREDYTQEMGLYGPIIVVPTDSVYWSPVNQELTLTLDDILLEEGKIVPFSRTLSDHTAMGRFGNVLLTNGETLPQFSFRQGEVVRLYLVNTANVRVFNVRLPGARMKLVGGDNGRVEHEEFIEEVLLSPSERVIIDIYFEYSGKTQLEHCTPERTYALANIIVQAQPAEPSFAQAFFSLRSSAGLEALRATIAREAEHQPDKTLQLVAEMPGMEHMEHHMGGQHLEAIEYDPHPPFGRLDWSSFDEMQAILTPLLSQHLTTHEPAHTIAFVLYPGLTVFDLAGPLEVFSALSRIAPRFRPVVVAEQMEPVMTDMGVRMVPNVTFADLPHPAMRRYIRTAAESAEWIVSVCTGALLLASVGLLEGCDVTTHWAYTRFLKNLGAHYVQQRWTTSCNIVNAAGVSSGIDMALYMVSRLTDEETARRVQWLIQYDPLPPFGGIDYQHMKLVPRVIRGMNSPRALFYTRKPRRLTRLEGKATVQQGKEPSSDLVGI